MAAGPSLYCVTLRKGTIMKLPIIIGVVALVAVLAAGAYVTEFTTYLGNNPTTCNNCHVMDAAYEGWYHGAHQRAATCNDCHTPHDLSQNTWSKQNRGITM
jgi:cytochrome c nitrite reductase small subunit